MTRNLALSAAPGNVLGPRQVSGLPRDSVVNVSALLTIDRQRESNRIAEGSVRAFFRATVTAIEPGRLRLDTPDGERTIGNDFVVAMTGYRPDYPLLDALGIEWADDDAMTPVHDATTFETNRPGIYLAGTICGGLRTGRWFIENGRHHAQQIAAHIARGEAPEIDFESRHWKTAE